VCLTLSAGLSSTYQAACAGADEVRERIEVRVVDTRTVTLGQALWYWRLRKSQVRQMIWISLSQLPVRSSRKSAYSGPSTLWTMSEGWSHWNRKSPLGVALVDQADHRDPRRCRRSRVATAHTCWLARVLGQQVEAGRQLEGLAVAHAAAPDLEVFLDMVDGLYPREDILINYIGPVIGTHAGPRCIGICYRLAETAEG